MSQENANPFNRRSFLKTAAGAAAAVTLPTLARAQSGSSTSTTMPTDTVMEIFTAALIAEDLAVVFYYQGLSGKVIQDVNLAGPGGTAYGKSKYEVYTVNELPAKN